MFSLTPNDRIHPDYDGHLVMAYLFLKTQGLANKPVADFSVNAKTKQVTKAVNCCHNQCCRYKWQYIFQLPG